MRRYVNMSLSMVIRRPQFISGSLNSVGQLSSRYYGWNPFLKRVIVEEDDKDVPIATRDAVNKVKQELRKFNSFDRLHELLFDLVESSPNKDSFVLINEILRKLEQQQFHQNSKHSKIPVNTQIPPISSDDAYKIFKIVIDHINVQNFKFARFIPRLYLQLTQVASNNGNQRLLLQIFNDFIRYLNILGYEEQLIKVVKSFVKENEYLSEPALMTVCLVLNNKNPSPVLTLAFLDLFSYTNVPSEKMGKLNDLVIQSIDFFLSRRNELFAIDQQNLISIRNYIEEAASRCNTPEQMCSLLKLCQEREELQLQERSILTKTIQFLLNKKYICNEEKVLNTYINSFIKNTSISYDERKIAGNIMIEAFSKTYQDSNKDLFDLYVQWDVFNDGFLSEKSQTYLLNQKKFVDQNTFTSIISSLAFSKSDDDFQNSLSSIYNFFENHFSDLDKTVDIYAILLQRGLRLSDPEGSKLIFHKSLEDGSSWDSKPKILCDFIYTLATQQDAIVEDVFEWYKKVKVFVEHLDSKSYNSLMKLFLEKEFIGDAIESLTKELPPLEKDVKYSVEQYPELFQSMYDWILEFKGNPEVSWTLYSELQKKFHLPYDTYLPMMAKFIEMKRPDAAFMIFQRLKIVHRKTGSIPPPTPEMYSFLFKKFGEDLYQLGVKDLHLIMKLDLQLNTDINVMNSLLGAYCNLQEFARTQETFDSIISMPRGKGLNNETISIMLKSYTYLSLASVQNFWDNLYEYDILPNEDNYKQYIIAFCYHEQYEKALQIASDVNNYDLVMTPEILQSLYTWTEGDENKKKIENWASKKHKLIWNKIDTQKKLSTISHEGNSGDVERIQIRESTA